MDTAPTDPEPHAPESNPGLAQDSHASGVTEMQSTAEDQTQASAIASATAIVPESQVLALADLELDAPAADTQLQTQASNSASASDIVPESQVLAPASDAPDPDALVADDEVMAPEQNLEQECAKEFWGPGDFVDSDGGFGDADEVAVGGVEAVDDDGLRVEEERAPGNVDIVTDDHASVSRTETVEQERRSEVHGLDDGSVLVPKERAPSPAHMEIDAEDHAHLDQKPQKTVYTPDNSSLFIPFERTSQSPTHTPTNSLPTDFFRIPSRPSARPSMPPSPLTPSTRATPLPSSDSRPRASGGLTSSTFSKIRSMQKRISESRNAIASANANASNLSALPQHPTPRHSTPLPQTQTQTPTPTHLDIILSKRSAFPSPSQPAESADDRADREALAKFEKQKKHYEELREEQGGKLRFQQDVAWMKIHSAEVSRRRKRKRDLELAGQEMSKDSTSKDSTSTGALEGTLDEFWEEEMDDDPAGSSRLSTPSSRQAFPSMLEAEMASMRVALQADGDKPVRKKLKGGGAPTSAREATRGRGRGSKAKAAPAASRAKASKRMTAKDKKALAKGRQIQTSLLHSDVFRQQADEDAPDQPTFNATNKAHALKQLISSVPIEHQKSARDDTQALLRATRDFDGRGSCKADGNGMWKIRGMATSLKHYQVMGTAFMRRRENDLHEPKGGLMADQMGLGKTLMSKSFSLCDVFLLWV